MTNDILRKAVELSTKVGYVLVATADPGKRPHLAVAGTLAIKESDRLEVNQWFCPTTFANLKANPQVAVVVWDKNTDTGYQIAGEMKHMMDIGMVEGYTPEMESKFLLPAVESQLLLRVGNISCFKRAPHSDVPDWMAP